MKLEAKKLGLILYRRTLNGLTYVKVLQRQTHQAFHLPLLGEVGYHLPYIGKINNKMKPKLKDI